LPIPIVLLVKGDKKVPNNTIRTNGELIQLYNRHVDTVYRVCFMYMKNRYDTEDMVQNTFIKLLKDQTRFESQEHEKAWLIKTASNLCKDHFRHWWNKTVAIDHADDVIKEEAEYTVSDILEKVLALPSKYKTVVYMYYYEGYTTVEIAKILNKNESTVRSHLRTGRNLLKIKQEGEMQ